MRDRLWYGDLEEEPIDSLTELEMVTVGEGLEENIMSSGQIEQREAKPINALNTCNKISEDIIEKARILEDRLFTILLPQLTEGEPNVKPPEDTEISSVLVNRISQLANSLNQANFMFSKLLDRLDL